MRRRGAAWVWVALVLAALGPAVSARSITFDNGLAPPQHNVLDDGAFNVLVRNRGCGPATFTSCLIPLEPTTVLLTGGTVGGPGVGGLVVRDSSVFVVREGRVRNACGVTDFGSVRIEGGWVDVSCRLQDDSFLHLAGGRLLSLEVFDQSQARVSGGSIDDIINTRGDAHVRITGGAQAARYHSRDQSRITIFAGTPTGTTPTIRAVGGVVEIIGSDFAVNGVPERYGRIQTPEGRLTGTLASGDPIDATFMQFWGPVYTGHIRLAQLEPYRPDEDGDGVADVFDNCIDVPNPDQLDIDLDRVGDACNDTIDQDGDDYADDRDTCPLVFNPDHADRDGNSVGDACNDALDRDGDEYEDDNDNCPDLDNDQADADGDTRGDACDEFPMDTFNLQALTALDQLRQEKADVDQQLLQIEGELGMCLDDPPFPDADGDGEHDRTDGCPDTPLGQSVGPGGCSVDQFCASIEATGAHGVLRCFAAHWPGDTGRSSSCRFVSRPRGCVARVR